MLDSLKKQEGKRGTFYPSIFAPYLSFQVGFRAKRLSGFRRKSRTDRRSRSKLNPRPANRWEVGERYERLVSRFSERCFDLDQQKIKNTAPFDQINDHVILDCCQYFSIRHPTGLLSADRNLCLNATTSML